MRKELLDEMNDDCSNQIFFIFVKSNFDRKLVETRLLDSVLDVDSKHSELQIFVDQRCNSSFYEEYGFEKKTEKEEMMEVNSQRFREKLMLLQYVGK